MFKFTILIIICLGFSLCKAQQVITLKNIKQNKTISIKLPVSVICKFKNGTNKQLLLEAVNGDSLIFKKYYNDTCVYDCSYNDLTNVRFHKRGETILSLGAIIFGTFTAISASLIVAPIIILSTQNFSSSGPGETGEVLVALLITGVPLTIINGTILFLFSRKIPKILATDKWALTEIK